MSECSSKHCGFSYAMPPSENNQKSVSLVKIGDEFSISTKILLWYNKTDYPPK